MDAESETGHAAEVVAVAVAVDSAPDLQELTLQETKVEEVEVKEHSLLPLTAPEVPEYDDDDSAESGAAQAASSGPLKGNEEIDDLSGPDPFATSIPAATTPKAKAKPAKKKSPPLLGPNDPQWFIRAAQGHSIQTITTEHLEPITDTSDTSLLKVGAMVHGTKWELWNLIREKGLSRVNRQHIHLTTARVGSRSGPRASSNLFIYLSLQTMLEAEPPIPVFVSSNDVILTPGDKDGFVPASMFERVVRRRKRKEVKEGEEVPDEVKPDQVEWDEVIWESGKAVEPPKVIVTTSSS